MPGFARVRVLALVHACVYRAVAWPCRAATKAEGIVVLTVDPNGAAAKAGASLADELERWAQADASGAFGAPIDLRILELTRRAAGRSPSTDRAPVSRRSGLCPRDSGD
jgi:hypothetical protein